MLPVGELICYDKNVRGKSKTKQELESIEKCQGCGKNRTTMIFVMFPGKADGKMSLGIILRQNVTMYHSLKRERKGYLPQV